MKKELIRKIFISFALLSILSFLYGLCLFLLRTNDVVILDITTSFIHSYISLILGVFFGATAIFFQIKSI